LTYVFGHTRYKPVRFMRPSSSYFASSIENLHCSVMSLSLSLKTVTKLRHHTYKYYSLMKNIIVMKTNERQKGAYIYTKINYQRLNERRKQKIIKNNIPISQTFTFSYSPSHKQRLVSYFRNISYRNHISPFKG